MLGSTKLTTCHVCASTVLMDAPHRAGIPQRRQRDSRLAGGKLHRLKKDLAQANAAMF